MLDGLHMTEKTHLSSIATENLWSWSWEVFKHML